MALARVRVLIVLLIALTTIGVIYSISLTEYVARDRLRKSFFLEHAAAAGFDWSMRRKIRLASDAEWPGTVVTERQVKASYPNATVVENKRDSLKTSINVTGVSISSGYMTEANWDVNNTTREENNPGRMENSPQNNELIAARSPYHQIEESLVSDAKVTSHDKGFILDSNATDKREMTSKRKRLTMQFIDPGESALRCPNLQRPVRVLQNGSSLTLKPPLQDGWQIVLEQLVFVFSAFRDPRVSGKNRVRVFGITLSVLLPDPVKSRFYCQLWTPKKLVFIVATRARATGYKHRYEGFVLDCDFPLEYQLKQSHFVSVTKFPCVNSNNALRIHGRPERRAIQTKYSVCLLGSIQAKSYRRFPEWLELNVLLGAERITVYVSDKSPEVKRMLMYQGQIVLESIPWTAPVFGAVNAIQTVLVNDCLYRAMSRTRYLVLLAVNETLAPGATWLRSWDDMLREAECDDSGQIVAGVTNLEIVQQADDVQDRDGKDLMDLSSGFVSRSRRSLQKPEDAIKGIIRPEFVDVISDNRVQMLDGVPVNPCIIPDHIGKLYRFS